MVLDRDVTGIIGTQAGAGYDQRGELSQREITSVADYQPPRILRGFLVHMVSDRWQNGRRSTGCLPAPLFFQPPMQRMLG